MPTQTRQRPGEAGFTLIETLLGMALGLFVVGAAISVLLASLASQPRASAHTSPVQSARTSMDQMTRELRQGLSVPTATASQLSVITYVDEATCGGASATTAIPCRVTYTCSAGACTRSVAPPSGGASGPSVRVVNGLSTTNVFTYGTGAGACTSASASAPTSVCVTLALPAGEGANAITLRDGVALRNA